MNICQTDSLSQDHNDVISYTMPWENQKAEDKIMIVHWANRAAQEINDCIVVELHYFTNQIIHHNNYEKCRLQYNYFYPTRKITTKYTHINAIIQ